MSEEFNCAVTNICRLCLNEGSLSDIFKMDGDLNFSEKASNCVQIKFMQGDGLPPLVCEICEQIITNFYKFKQKCLENDLKLKSLNCISKQTPFKVSYSDTDLENFKIDIKLESELITKLDNDFKETIDTWLSDNIKPELDIKYIENEIEKYTDEIKQITTSINDDCKYPLITESKNIKGNLSNSLNNLQNAFQCELCGKIIKVKSALKKHLLIHKEEKLFSCHLCPKKFSREEHKIVHIRSHLGIRPYICDICGVATGKSQDLLRHMRIHSDEKNYSCPTCNKRFKRSGDVKCHMRTHTGARPYTCKTCDKHYTSHSGLRKHYKKHCKDKAVSNATV